MTQKEIAAGVVHKVPVDLRKTLASTPAARVAWENITPLARNEWICWIESVKKPETKNRRIERTRKGLIDGKRRPCCWAGCPHR
ncbi:YdeI/OmpD-associated family protein [Candidatus Woesearchaeota archaeon]|nr:YdeI/OmpD-associated family protein [Candidatus Woesearchaeota archaeon]